MPKCDFACKECYLGEDANRARPRPLADIKRQLDDLRAWLGPAGNVQLGYAVDYLTGLYENRSKNGIDFTSPPRAQHGALLAKFRDNDGRECSISGKR